MAVSSDNSGLFFEAEVDDDVFYAEIRDWILQLTTEEDDEKDDNNSSSVGQFLGETKHVNKPIVSGGGDGGSLYGSGYGYENGFPVGGSHNLTWEAQNCGGPPPVWLMNMWKKNGKGTGVFIPQAVVGCKKNPPRTGRMNSRRKTYKPVARPRIA